MAKHFSREPFFSQLDSTYSFLPCIYFFCFWGGGGGSVNLDTFPVNISVHREDIAQPPPKNLQLAKEIPILKQKNEGTSNIKIK